MRVICADPERFFRGGSNFDNVFFDECIHLPLKSSHHWSYDGPTLDAGYVAL